MLSKEKIRIAKFAFVGILNSGVDYAVFLLLVYGLQIPVVGSQVVSYSAGTANSYFWNRKWTFRLQGGGSWADMVRFAVLNAASFAAATAVLLGLDHGLGWPPYAAKALSIIFSMAVNYLGNRFWVFRMELRQNRAG